MLNFNKSSLVYRFFLVLSIFSFSLLFIDFCSCATKIPNMLRRFGTPMKLGTPDRTDTPDIVVRQDLPDIIVDHDSGVDDVISCLLQMKYSIIKQRRSMRYNNIRLASFRVRAFTISPADSFREPAAWVMKRLVKLVLPGASFAIPIGVGTNPGKNPFPSEWREDAWKLTQLGIWGQTPVSREEVFATYEEGVSTPFQVLSSVLDASSEPVDILETGPCTNLAELLIHRPDLKNKINRVYMMGGAVYVDGNVKEVPGHDGSAEWNIFNNPVAFKILLERGVPITLVSLDATQYTPIRKEFQEELKLHLNEKPFRFVSESLDVIQFLIDIGQYMFWDTLTSAVTINPNIINTERVKINVMLDGPSLGKTFIDNENGHEIDLAIWANQELFEHTVREILIKKR